ncbi:uncharacterized protein CBL_03031 [Carabus blaptoides fortunei]
MDTEELFQADRNASNSSVAFTNFNDRQKSLFDQLKQAEDTNKNRIIANETPMDMTTLTTGSNKRKRSETKETKYLQGRESIFKRPEQPLSKCLPRRHVPDFKKNPHKWTKYSLDDVPNEDTSEQGNTNAALSFLREIEERKKSQLEDIDADDNVKSKPRFNTSVMVRNKKNTDDDEKLSFKGTKIVMPEYIVGQKKKPTKKIVTTKNESKAKLKEIKLAHLDEYEDD